MSPQSQKITNRNIFCEQELYGFLSKKLFEDHLNLGEKQDALSIKMADTDALCRKHLTCTPYPSKVRTSKIKDRIASSI